jgi:secretion/DNA translocation related TadE-like protein
VTPRDERGLAAPLVVGLAGVLAFVTLGGAVLGRVAVDERRADAAADLAALAGATELQYGRAGCPAARRTAAENDAILTRCVERDDTITVTVVVPAELLGRSVQLRGTAKAGPVDG